MIYLADTGYATVVPTMDYNRIMQVDPTLIPTDHFWKWPLRQYDITTMITHAKQMGERPRNAFPYEYEHAPENVMEAEELLKKLTKAGTQVKGT
jgi:hypothetical protein